MRSFRLPGRWGGTDSFRCEQGRGQLGNLEFQKKKWHYRALHCSGSLESVCFQESAIFIDLLRLKFNGGPEVCVCIRVADRHICLPICSNEVNFDIDQFQFFM